MSLTHTHTVTTPAEVLEFTSILTLTGVTADPTVRGRSSRSPPTADTAPQSWVPGLPTAAVPLATVRGTLDPLHSHLLELLREHREAIYQFIYNKG